MTDQPLNVEDSGYAALIPYAAVIYRAGFISGLAWGGVITVAVCLITIRFWR